MQTYLFVLLFLHSRAELNVIIKEAVSFDEKDNGLVVPFFFLFFVLFCLIFVEAGFLCVPLTVLGLPPKHLSILFVAIQSWKSHPTS